MEQRSNQQILHLDPACVDDVAINLAVKALAAGKLVVVPTETVYGVAADPHVEGAVDKLYDAKNRESAKPIAMLVADVEQIEAPYNEWPEGVRKLASAFWPGPLTLVLGVEPETKGYRMPDHPVALALIRRVGHGLAVTSANRSGERPAVSADEAARDLGEDVEIVLDAGISPGGMPSTVVRCGSNGFDVLRAGAIPAEEIEKVLS